MSAKQRTSGQTGLVVDACVAMAAGATEGRAGQCRRFLLEMYGGLLLFVLSPAIRKEWDEHQSSFARSWRVRMYGRRLVRSINPPCDTQRRAAWSKVHSGARAQEALLKDAHLLEAAIATDRIVVSCDKTARQLYGLSAQTAPELKQVVWLDPDDPNQTCKGLISSGDAFRDGRYRLGPEE